MNRRRFLQDGFASLTTYLLLDRLWTADALAAKVRPELERWVRELDEISRDLKTARVPGAIWQDRVESLIGTIPLADLLADIDFDRLRSGFQLPDLGAGTRPVRLPRPGGLPDRLAFYHKIFGLRQGRAIIPHGHANMASMHVVLEGEFALRQYDRVGEDERSLSLRPTVDRAAGPGDASSISDDRNNVHWFRTLTPRAFTFDVIVTNVNPDHGREYRIDNLDIDAAEETPDGLLRAPRLPVEEALQKYG